MATAQNEGRTYAAQRAELETRIEEMIALLDELDGDPDLEEGGDLEPSLCGLAQFVGGNLEHDLEGDFADDEPDLGWGNIRGPGYTFPEGWDSIDATDFDNSGGFRGDGQRIARRLLRKVRAA